MDATKRVVKPKPKAKPAAPQIAPIDPDADIDADGSHGACVALAWQLLAEGVYTWRAIARGVNARHGCNHDHKWAQRAIRSHSQLMAEAVADPAVDHRAKYIQGLHTDLAALAQVANTAGRDADRIAARRAMIDIREKLAAACAVVTQRRSEELNVNLNARDELIGRITGLAARRRESSGAGEPE
jgi:hypothetical protein